MGVMQMSVTKKKDPNASASAFGWEFQTNAAIYMMLQNIKVADYVKVEGKTEDIEIYLSDGNVIYSQAKAFHNQGDNSNTKKKLYAALRTLNDASKNSSATKLVYITNSFNPFDVKDAYVSMTFFGLKEVDFSDLPDTCREIIDKEINKQGLSNLHTEKLSIWILPFSGKGENKYQILKTEVNEFLNSVNVGSFGIGQEIMSIWQRKFGINATELDRDKTISKKEMVWPVIVMICRDIKSDDFLDDCDDGLVRDVSRRFKEFIDTMTERFDFMTRVLGLYEESRETQHELTRKEYTSWFINNRWVNYKDEFYYQGVDSEVLEILTKLIIKKVIDVRYTVSGIKKEVSL